MACAPGGVQLRLAQRISDLLTSAMVSEAIQARWMAYLLQIDPRLATQVHEVSPTRRYFHLVLPLSCSMWSSSHAVDHVCMQASAGVLQVPGIAAHSNSTVFPP